MDPLPFLFVAVLIFGSLQSGVKAAWHYWQRPTDYSHLKNKGSKFIKEPLTKKAKAKK